MQLSMHKNSIPGFTVNGAIGEQYGFLLHLHEQNILSRENISHVCSLSSQTDEPFDLILCKLGLIAEPELAAQFSAFFNLPLLSQVNPLDINQKKSFSLGELNQTWLKLRRIIPLYKKDNAVIAAIVNPTDQQCIEGLSFALNKPVKPVIATQSQWENLNIKAESITTERDHQNISAHNLAADVERLKDMASAEPVVRLVNRLLFEASEARASDIHIEPGARDTHIRFRVDGMLSHHETLNATQALSVTSRIKILCQLDIAERRRPQDGRFSFPVAGRTIDLRISTVPTDHGESVVIRLLDQSRVPLDLSKLGFFPDAMVSAARCLEQPHGILLVTGPTGSGKTTTLYTFLQSLANGDRKILTIEDPIEYRLDGINQSQTNPAIGITFASALRSFLRHDPDVMMVGEIRDLETAQIAVQAALTGHLVLSTLHTNDAHSAITRLRDIGVEDYLIASTLIGVLGQRLVRKLCDCRSTNDQADPSCAICSGSGYAGRIALIEIFEMDDTYRDLIRTGQSPDQYLAHSDGAFISMAMDGARKTASGLTSQAEVSRAVGKASMASPLVVETVDG